MVFAQDRDILNPLGGRFTNMEAVYGFLYNLFLGAGAALSVTFIIMAGIKYVTSEGDVKAVASARSALTYAIVGFVVTISAFMIRNVIMEALGG